MAGFDGDEVRGRRELDEVPGWRARSPFVLREGNVDMHHFDPNSQALSKLERGFDQDLEDVRAMRERGLIDPPGLREFYARIEPELYRFPAISPAAFRRRVVEASSSPS